MLLTPTITVVMPAYNAATYLDEAVTCILNQTFRDFEFIIINDGSTDNTGSILDRYKKLDSRIRVYHQENQGMIAALNRGCQLARGKYIARMDADDVSVANRLERQLSYIEAHPDIGILGSWISIEKNSRIVDQWCPPTNSKRLKWELFFGVCVAHPSVLMRREVIERLNFYRPDASHGEDGDLWFRASAITEFGNVPEVLLKYRVWPKSTSQVHSQLRSQAHITLLASFIKDVCNLEPPIEAVTGLRQLRVGPRFQSLGQIRLTALLVEKLYQRFLMRNHLESHERREIAFDAAKKIGSLALQASRLDAYAFMLLLVKALKTDCRLLSPSALMRGVTGYLRTSDLKSNG